jgi:hypothetical protein
MAQANSVPSPNLATNTDASLQQTTTKPRRIKIKPADRRYFIGGSDARIVMGNDEAALLRLWSEKRGEVEPQDVVHGGISGNRTARAGRTCDL